MHTLTQEQALPRLDISAADDAARAIRAGLLIILIAFVAAGGWMALAPVAGAVIAQGTVKVDMNRKTVQHQEGGTVKQVLVRDGDRVRQGQVLVVLDDVRVDAAYDSLKTQYDSELARNARLSADRVLTDEPGFPDQLKTRAAQEPKVAEVLQRELTLFKARRQTLHGALKHGRQRFGASWMKEIEDGNRDYPLLLDR